MTQQEPARCLLRWPESQPRTPWGAQEESKFKVDKFNGVIDNILRMLKRHGASRIDISSNWAVRSDGLPYAGQREPQDTGIAVWWTRKGVESCIAVDKYRRARDNLHAVELCLGALFGLERWGAKEMVGQALSGFEMVRTRPPEPERPPRTWREVLEMPAEAGALAPAFQLTLAKAQRARLVLEHHPDRNGGRVTEEYLAIDRALELAEEELRG